jgi:hypothetical protein
MAEEQKPIETPENTTPEAEAKEVFMLPDGRSLPLTKEEKQYLIVQGLARINEPEKGKEEPKQEPKDGPIEDKVEATLKAVTELRKELDEDKRQTRLSTIRKEIDTQIAEECEKHELTKGDKDLSESARALVINKLLTNPTMSVADAFKSEIKHFERVAKKAKDGKQDYAKKKKEDAENTRGGGKGGGAPANEGKMTGKDLMSGNLRRTVNARIRAEKGSRFS